MKPKKTHLLAFYASLGSKEKKEEEEEEKKENLNSFESWLLDYLLT